MRVVKRLRPDNEYHVPRSGCECGDCEMDREVYGCDHPHRCAIAAERFLEKLKPKWNLAQSDNCDQLSLTKNRRRANETAKAEKGRVIFDPTVVQDGPLAAAFRVFTNKERDTSELAVRQPRPFGIISEEVEVYTDGSSTQNGMANAVAGSGVWFADNDVRNEGARVPYDEQTNQAAEIYAIVMAESKVPPFAPLHIVSDSKYVVDGLTTHLAAWESRGWIDVANAIPFREAAAALRSRSAVTMLRWVKGHSGVHGNEEADKLAAAGAEKLRQFRPIALPKTRYLHDGAAVSILTQSLAYRGVKCAEVVKVRKVTRMNMQLIVEAVQDACNISPLERGVWAALRKDPISRTIQDFFWRTIHGAQRVGRYWTHIPGYEGRAMCGVCGVVEDMEHILTTCCAPGQNLIWRIVRRLMREKAVDMPQVSFGIVLGAPMYTVHSAGGAVLQGPTRAARLILSEAAHTIWVLRCERVIAWEDTPRRRHTDNEIRNKLGARLNRRIAMDQGATNARMHKKRAIAENKVKQTWNGLLRNNEDLPDDWIGIQGVLVGIPTLAELREPG